MFHFVHNERYKFVILLPLWVIPTVTSNQQFHRIAEHNERFSNQLNQAIISSRRGMKNMMCSPLSVEMSMAMLKLGARGNTAQQITSAMRMDNDDMDGYKRLMNWFKMDTNVTIRVVNRAYVSTNANLNQSFVLAINNKLDASIRKVDFSRDDTAQTINNWVEESTENHISSIVDSNSFDRRTSLFMVNALYFKGNWRTPFEKTTMRPFMDISRRSMQMPFMEMMVQQKDKFKFGHVADIGASVLEVPYMGEVTSLVVMLPDEGRTLEQLEHDVYSHDMYSLMSQVRWNWGFNVFLPKFRIEVGMDLKEYLMKMGMTDMFSQTSADFSGISSDHHYFVTRVMHKTFLELSNEGTESSASEYSRSSMMSVNTNSPPNFDANKPFLFFIMRRIPENQRIITLFSGTFVSPANSHHEH